MFDHAFAQDISKEQLKSLLNALLAFTSENVVIISPQHQVLAFNQTISNFWISVLGRRIQLGDDYREYVHEKNMDVYLSSVNNALTGHSTETSVSSFNLTYDFTITPIISSNVVIGIMLISKNKTEYLKQKELINKHETVLKTILNNTTNGIIFFDLAHKITAFNPAAQQMFKALNGSNLEIGLIYRDTLPVNNHDRYDDIYRKALDGITIEFDYYTKSFKGAKWIRYKTGPIYDDNNNMIGISWTLTDIHEQKKLELKLEHSEAKFRNIVEAAPTAMLIVNSRMDIVQVNKEFETLFGYDRNKIVGENLHMLIPERFHANHNEHQKSYQQQPTPYKMGSGRFTPAKKKDGSEIVVEISLNSFMVDAEQFVMAIIQDVSLRIKHEEQIKNQLERLKEIAWHQSHKVRQPLSNLLGLMEILKMEPNQTNEELSRIKDMVLLSAKNLDEAVKDIVKRAQKDE